ncbi:MAG: hypothetical protein ACRETH_06550 [Steroidobacteraceae bacterium]
MGATEAALVFFGAIGATTGQGPAGGLKPRAPALPPVAPMPDITQATQAGTIAEAQAAALRQGRASTVLTAPGSSSGDRLGP